MNIFEELRSALLREPACTVCHLGLRRMFDAMALLADTDTDVSIDDGVNVFGLKIKCARNSLPDNIAVMVSADGDFAHVVNLTSPLAVGDKQPAITAWFLRHKAMPTTWLNTPDFKMTWTFVMRDGEPKFFGLAPGRTLLKGESGHEEDS